MKNKTLIFGIVMLLSIYFAACNNPIMEKWWNKKPEEKTTVVSNLFYKVEFDANGGFPAPGEQYVAQDGKISKVQAMARAGSGFGGWFTEPGFVNEWNFAADTVKGPLKLYAKWVQIDDIFVKFVILGVPSVMEVNLISGSKVEPPPFSMIAEAGEYLITPPDTLDDYSFDGWYTDNACVFRWDFATRTVTESLTLYARWLPLATLTLPYYTVTFETNDISLSVDPQRIVQGGNAIEPPAMNRDGFGFGGWFMDTEFKYRFNFAAPVSDSRPLYAKWDTNYYTVTFNANGGLPPPDSQRVAHNALVTWPGSMSNNDMRFGGWYSDAGYTKEWNFAADTVTGNMALNARWEAAPVIPVFTVTFNANGGNPAPAEQRIIQGGKATEPSPMRQAIAPGSDIWMGFGGWYRDSGFANEWVFSRDAVNDDLTLYAKWATPPHCLVTFEANGGDPVPRNQDLLENTRIVEPLVMSRPGYGFGGWYLDTAFKNKWDFSDPVPNDMENITLYAYWVTNFYTVNFVANGGYPAPASQKIAHGNQINKPSAMKRSGMGFIGWYEDAEFSAEWDFSSPVEREGITLYAKWLNANYLVQFNLKIHPDALLPEPPPGGHGINPPEQELSPGGRIAEPPPPAVSGWSFYGWYYYTGNNEAAFLDKISQKLELDELLDLKDLEAWDFDRVVTQEILDDELSLIHDGDNEILTIYARWVPVVADMVWVRKGSFMMGTGTSGDAAPVHKVGFNTGFYMSKNLVTQEEYEIVLEPEATAQSDNRIKTPSQFKADQPTRPVDRVSWYDAVFFCNEKTSQQAVPKYGSLIEPVYSIDNIIRTPTGNTATAATPITSATVTADWSKNGYRLATEAEWEYAARGGDGSPGNLLYSGSNTAEDVAWFNTNSGSMTHQVGTKMPNSLGLYDMSGNVSEWCWDWYDSRYYASPEAQTNNIDRTGPPSGTQRVRRGGNWNNAVNNVRSAVRNYFPPDNATWVMGFRLVCGPSMVY